MFLVVGLWVWKESCEDAAHRPPQADYMNIQKVVQKTEWTDSEYMLLQEQTGLSKEALKNLQKFGKQEMLPNLQQAYFADVEICCVPNTPVTCEEFLTDGSGSEVKGMLIPYVEDGDILVTNCSHFLGWRNGHAGIVIDAQNRLVLEAQVLGSPTVVNTLERWEKYPSFVVLRLKDVDLQKREKIAAYAAEKLIGVPYRLTAGIFGREDETINGTQCAHLIWTVYKKFGYDLDSDGGVFITPKDLAESSLLITVQEYGTGT